MAPNACSTNKLVVFSKDITNNLKTATRRKWFHTNNLKTATRKKMIIESPQNYYLFLQKCAPTSIYSNRLFRHQGNFVTVKDS